MDARQLDDLAREIGSQVPRRSVVSALGGLAALLASPALDGDARKKKKKKKCKRGKKKCGRKCIARDQCCRAADCGGGAQCVKGTCVCPTGTKACNGDCIPQNSCCENSNCPGDQTCSNGECKCPTGSRTCGAACIPDEVCCVDNDCPNEQECIDSICLCPDGFPPCPGDTCPTGIQCCADTDCGVGQECEDGFCWCSSAGEVYCGETCCDAATDPVCNWDETGGTCQAGGCEPFDWCNVPEDSVCKDDPDGFCVCITSYAPEETVTASCVDPFSLIECGDPCEDTSDCDAGYVCVGGNTSEDGFCGCEGKFCALECGAAVERHAERRASRAGISPRDLKHRGRTR